MTTARKHLVAIAHHGWGPLIVLCSRLVRLRRVDTTIVTVDSIYGRVEAEVARNFSPDEKEYAKRIRVVSVGDLRFLETAEHVDEGFKPAWEKLVAGEPLVCAKTSAQIPALPKPQAVIADTFCVDAVAVVKALSGDSVKVYAWHSASTYSLFTLFGPEKLGGFGNVRQKAEEEVKRTGKSYRDAVFDIALKPKGDVKRLPGIPPMYDYEYFAQDFMLPDQVLTGFYPRVYETIAQCNGVILASPEPFEPEAVQVIKEYFAETSREAYVCGPLQSHARSTASEQLSENAKAISEFLETTLKTSGEKSLLYVCDLSQPTPDDADLPLLQISFGSAFWPAKTPEKVWAFLDVVMERNIPFILSHGSPFAVIPDEIKAKVAVYGKGLLSPWSPQQTILEHPATGWFVCHGGHNSVIESISAGVPFIMWPFGGDQPVNALHITALGIGYELLEIRSGTGLRPLYRSGVAPTGTLDALHAEAHSVLERAYGEDGAQKRARLRLLQKAVLAQWEEGGRSLKEASAFLDSL
ncbi:UDP-Glycosyltransferase/glycogen phosphorylase [Trametes elegans]|nr:UDP-Glycosyltransferase/glycogen phosphorylase [Trametes elegans]